MEKEIILRVYEIPQKDVGWRIARLSTISMLMLGLNTGDVIEIEGKKITVARVFPVDKDDEKKKIIRIDGYTRRNARVALGDKVKVRKAEPVEAQKIIIAPLIGKNQRLRFGEGVDEFIRKILLKIPVLENEELVIPNITLDRKNLLYYVVKTVPSNRVVQVGTQTTIELREDPPQIMS